MDKILNRYIFISFIFISLSYASTVDIDEQIAKIKKAPESERVILMNQFKRQLILMNQEQRQEAIAQLKNTPSEEVPSSQPLENQSNNFINTLQHSSLMQQVQMESDNAIETQTHRESIPVPQPTTTPILPSQQPEIPSTNQPNMPQPVSPIKTPSTPLSQPEIPVEPPKQPEIVNHNNLPVVDTTIPQQSMPSENQPTTTQPSTPITPNPVTPPNSSSVTQPTQSSPLPAESIPQEPTTPLSGSQNERPIQGGNF